MAFKLGNFKSKGQDLARKEMAFITKSTSILSSFIDEKTRKDMIILSILILILFFFFYLLLFFIVVGGLIYAIG